MNERDELYVQYMEQAVDFVDKVRTTLESVYDKVDDYLNDVQDGLRDKVEAKNSSTGPVQDSPVSDSPVNNKPTEMNREEKVDYVVKGTGLSREKVAAMDDATLTHSVRIVNIVADTFKF